MGMASLLGTNPASAASSSPDALKNAGILDKPAIVLVETTETAYVQDNRTGKTYGQPDGSPFTTSFFGTGFFISSDGYIVTAAHVAAPTPESVKQDLVELYLEQDAHDPNVGDCEATGNCQAMIDSHRASYLLSTNLTESTVTSVVLTQNMTAESQALPAELKESSPNGERDAAVLKVNQENTPVLLLGDSSTVQDQDSISVIGYPGIAMTGMTGGNIANLLVPTITTGTITAHKKGSADIGFANGVNILQTDVTVEHGNSGGPAINSEGKVIGIVSFGASSTTNFLITSNDIRDLVRASSAVNQLGHIDQLWRDGMGYYNQQRYKKAAPLFHECAELNPVQVGCAAFDKKATANFPNDQEAKFAAQPVSNSSSMWLILAILGGAVLIAIVVVVLVVSRRRGRAASASMPMAVPTPGAMPLSPPAVQPPPPPAAPPLTPTPSAATDSPSPVAATPSPSPKFCPQCGTPMAEATVCGNCGYRWQ